MVIALNPSQLLVLVFLAGITFGAFFLRLPFATTDGITITDAFFTATSAMTVTGLASVDTGTTFTLFGELVILALIQLGGLGIMTFAVLIYIVLGRKIGLKERMLVQQALNHIHLGGVIALVRKLFIYSIVIELLATGLLSIRWVPQFGWAEGMYVSFFHSVSAFNNAGFSVWSDSLSQYAFDPVINVIIPFLFIVGGIGFTVLVDLWSKDKIRKLSLHTKLMIVGTLVLNVVATLTILLLEYQNPATLGSLSLFDKLQAAFFQGVSPRTAGFNTIDIGSMDESSLFFMMFLMFIGGGSASTAGGIKLTTFIIIALAVITFIKGKREVVIWRKTIPTMQVYRALSITTMGVLFAGLAIFLLNITDTMAFFPIAFEVVSAFGTVGLSMGITGSLSIVGKWIIMIVMVIGKLGPLTLAFTLTRTSQVKISYPEEEVLTG
ncbi:Ktr system potassium transporter B [Bacillus coahuilensis p1.1.43]|uniref:Ktr system potassium transporter B n=1 Tax=Bacillus coahuilensis p1.1.43 TaxID=1150625 RepID=A0A147K423_9BACI|nr:TrkH family potassium uptake protein [Bacillus coahuilensis]KUP04045.1 Ktr system potassium transporter B [Bacillus coahuilensis p1.1.43]